jgi:hypothetical protein
MSDEKKSANASDSLTEPHENETPTSEGKKTQKSHEQLAKEYQAEARRKSEENTTLKTELQEMKQMLAELKRKEEESGLSKREESKMDDLESDIQDAVKKLRTQKDTQPWIHLAKEEMTNAMIEHQIELGNEYLEDKAEELGMEVKKLASELSLYALKHQSKRPARRNELAFREWQKDQAKAKELAEKEKKLKELEDKEKAFREGGGRVPRKISKDEAFESADKSGRLDAIVDLIG